MMTLDISSPAAEAALDRLISLAMSDTGQSARVANFLLAWWDDSSWGAFPISDMFGLDKAVGLDIATIVGYLATYPGAVYPDAFSRRGEMAVLVDRWRPAPADAAA